MNGSESVRELLRRHGQVYFSNSPVFLSLIDCIGYDGELLELLLEPGLTRIDVTLKQLLAMIHEAAIRAPDSELARFFPNLGGTSHPQEPAFKSAVLGFIKSSRPRIAERLSRRQHIVKTDIRRIVTLKALASSAWQELGTPADYALVDLGCGMGLNLLMDRYPITVSASEFLLQVGTDSLPVTRTAGGLPDFGLPRPRHRVGIDLYRLNPGSTSDRCEILSFLQPEDTILFSATKTAMDSLVSDRPDIRIGSADDLLGGVLEDLEPDLPVIIMHSMFFHFLTPEARATIAATLKHQAGRRPLAKVSMEIVGPAARLGLITGNPLRHRTMGRACTDGRWLDWGEERP